ncbi:MAG: hypothetical protein WBF66_09440 [Dehalococcoidia bacterium]
MTRLLENAVLLLALIAALAGLLFIMGLIPVTLGGEDYQRRIVLGIPAFATIALFLLVLVIRRYSRRDR